MKFILLTLFDECGVHPDWQLTIPTEWILFAHENEYGSATIRLDTNNLKVKTYLNTESPEFESNFDIKESVSYVMEVLNVP